MRCLVNKSGFTLAVSLLLVVFISITVLSTTVFLVHRLAQTRSQLAEEKAIYLSQAGINQALYNFRNYDEFGLGYVSLGRTFLANQDCFVTDGTDADLFMVDTSNTFLGGALTQSQCQALGDQCRAACLVTENQCFASCEAQYTTCANASSAQLATCLATCPAGGSGRSCRTACNNANTARLAVCSNTRTSCRAPCTDNYQSCRTNCSQEETACIQKNRLINLFVENATNSRTITIARMIVTWNNSRRLERIKIDGLTVWSGSVSSPANADIVDFTLGTIPTRYEFDLLRFSGDMNNAVVSIRFVMLDGSYKDVSVIPASNNCNFSLKSTGKTAGSNIYRTIKAEYNSLTGKITNFWEINEEVLP